MTAVDSEVTGDGISRQGTLPTSELDALLAEMRRGTAWRDALKQLHLPELSKKHHWFTDAEKARFYVQRQTAARHRAIDIGAGSGVIAAALAAGGYAEVVALEHHAGWCDFMRLRYAQDGVDRVEVVQGSAVPALPFPDAHFDLVVVNGVLEWIPDADPKANPGATQLAFLREVRRVLTPDGVLAIAIENRLYIRNFQGYGPHAEPPYAVLMPRRLASWYTKRKKGEPYRTWIYSYIGYRKLVREAGFTDVVIRPVLPSYHMPEQVVPISDGQAVLHSLSVGNPLKRGLLALLSIAGVLGYLAHSFYIEARPGPPSVPA